MNSPAQFIDHTLLRADAREDEIALLCEEAVEYGFASVCVPPCHVSFARTCVYGSAVAVGTVVGFPLGYQATQCKSFETSRAVNCGAAEVDMVIQLGAARAGRFDLVQQDIEYVVKAAGDVLVKVIIETCLFNPEQKRQLTELVIASGAGYVKTSTGFAASGASADDVRLLAAVAAGRVGVKAAGGIRDWPTCQSMLSAGAGRIGSSSGVAIMRQWLELEGVSCR